MRWLRLLSLAVVLAAVVAPASPVTTDGVFTEFFSPGLAANWITGGSDGNLWFTNGNNQIGRITLDGDLRGFLTICRDSSPEVITVGPDGNLWFTEPGCGRIGVLRPPS
jgi:streptogramin lyase